MKDDMDRQIIKKFFRLIVKKQKQQTPKKVKCIKKCTIKGPMNFQIIKTVQIENKINHLEKNIINEDGLEEDQK